MESSKELLPCPFCGGPAERVNIDSTDEHEPNCGGSYISCPSCLACSKVVFGEKIGLEEAWNMRTTHDRALEALDTAIHKECADEVEQLRKWQREAVKWLNVERINLVLCIKNKHLFAQRNLDWKEYVDDLDRLLAEAKEESK